MRVVLSLILIPLLIIGLVGSIFLGWGSRYFLLATYGSGDMHLADSWEGWIDDGTMIVTVPARLCLFASFILLIPVGFALYHLRNALFKKSH